MSSSNKYGLLPRLSVNRPVTTLMTLLALLVVGVIAYSRIPIEMKPSGHESLRLSLFFPYPNASPLDAEQKIGKPLEEILGTVSNVERMSVRCYDSGVRCSLSFYPETPMKFAYSEVRDRIDRLMPELPEEVERVYVYKYSESDQEVMDGAIMVENWVEDPEYLIERYVVPALQRIEGVANVEIEGNKGSEVRVELDIETLAANDIDVNEINQLLRNGNFDLGAGYVREGGDKYFLRSIGKFDDLEGLRNLPVDIAKGIRLKDVSKIYVAVTDNWRGFRFEGQQSYGYEIYKTSHGNAVEISEAVHAAFERLSVRPALKGLRFNIDDDQGVVIRKSIDNLKFSGLSGIVFAFVVLILFLHSAKTTLSVAMAIPLSMTCVIVFLYFYGWTLNLATMMGLLICVGLVVDNAVVVVENIHARREFGDSPKVAALRGSSEVGMAITMATLTTVVGLAPILFLGSLGDLKLWLISIGVPVMIGLLGSLVIALYLIPAASVAFAETLPKRAKPGGGPLRRMYERNLRWALKRRVEVAILIAAACAVTWIYGVPKLNISNRGGGGSVSQVYLQFELPGGQSFEETSKFLELVETFVEEQRTLYDYKSYNVSFYRTYARAKILLKENEVEWYTILVNSVRGWFGYEPPTRMTREEILRHFNANFLSPPGVTSRVDYSTMGSDRGFSINLYGDDTETLLGLSKEAERRLRAIEGLVGVETEVDPSNQELRVQLDRVKAERLGVSSRAVSGAISSNMRGSNVGYFELADGREWQIKLWLEEEDRETFEKLARMTFKSESGEDVPLESIASVTFANATNSIRREDRKTLMRLRALVTREDSDALYQEVDAAMSGFEMPHGYSWDKGSGYSRMYEDRKNVGTSVAVAALFVVMLMGIMFESFIMPLAICLAIPLAGVGVTWGFIWTGTSFGQMANIGAILLVGVVVNNGIVLVDLANRLRDEGKPRLDALIEAGKQRFRPIWMTTLTTVFGMVPMAIGGAEFFDMPYAPLGRVIIFGLLTATMLTLIVVPVFYTFLDDLRLWAGARYQSTFFGKRPRKDETNAKV